MRDCETAQVVDRLFSCRPSDNSRTVQLLELFSRLVEVEVSDELDFGSFNYEDIVDLIRYVLELADKSAKSDLANPLADGLAVSEVVRDLFRLAPTGEWDDYF